MISIIIMSNTYISFFMCRAWLKEHCVYELMPLLSPFIKADIHDVPFQFTKLDYLFYP